VAADDPPLPAGLKRGPLERKKPPDLIGRGGFEHHDASRAPDYTMGMNTLKPERPLFVVLRSMKSLADEWPSPVVMAV
jgi:hypothetical protein